MLIRPHSEAFLCQNCQRNVTQVTLDIINKNQTTLDMPTFTFYLNQCCNIKAIQTLF